MNRSPNAAINVILESFHKSTVLVIEDVMQDEHIAGKASRIFPEAPIPIVEVEDRMLFPESLAAPPLRALTILL
jgi:D-glycero-beta-D-manno-heptose-7-phosphate kinase